MTEPQAPEGQRSPWAPPPEFTAKPPRTLSWHAWWAIPVIGLVILAVVRPWEGESAVVFTMKAPAWATAPSPQASAASAPAPRPATATMPVQVLVSPAPAVPASR
jgi:hypothetical protein